MFRLVVTGTSIKELAENAQKFVDEAKGQAADEVDKSQTSFSPVAMSPSLPVASAAPVQPAVPSHSASFDSKGMPWDERIHATTKVLTKDGAWRYRRGVEDWYIGQIEQELIAKVKGAQAAQMTPPPPVAAPAPVGNVYPPPAMSIAPVAAVAQPSAPLMAAPSIVTNAVPPIPVPPAITSAHSLETFKANLVPTLAKLVQDGKITQEYINALKKHFVVEQIWEIKDDQLSAMFEEFCKAGFLTKVR